jgi:hypothetical protein
MKYIKTYEEIDPCLIYDDCRDCYMWMIPQENSYIALRKIGMNDKDAKDFSTIYFKTNPGYIFKTIEKDGTYNWSGSGLGYHRTEYRKPEIYMGEVEVSPDEIDLYQSTDKYNL